MSAYGSTHPAKRNSAALTDGVDRAPARAMLKGAGFTDADLAKPLIGVATTWIETMPCNLNHRLLARYVKQGIRGAGGTPLEFNTIAVSDGVTMGAAGMRASLVSREVIADSIELVTRGHHFDGLVCIVGCDKTIPAAVMALARLDLPGLVFYSGSIAAGRYRGKDVTIQDVFEAVGRARCGPHQRRRGARTRERRLPRAGACGGHFTANTMATARLPRRQRTGAERGPGDPSRQAAGRRPRGRARDEARWQRHAPVTTRDGRSIERSRRSRRPAARRTASTCWRSRPRPASSSRSTTSTRSPPARRSSRTSSRAAASSQPISSRPAASRSSRVSWCAPVWFCEEARSVDGRSLRQVADGAHERPGQDVVVSWDHPLKPTGGLAILRGNLAPDGCVVKLAGHERLHHRGPARVFDSEEDCFAAVKARGTIEPGDVVVIRYEGPAGGPGMREMLHVTAALVGEGSATRSR